MQLLRSPEDFYYFIFLKTSIIFLHLKNASLAFIVQKNPTIMFTNLLCFEEEKSFLLFKKFRNYAL